MSNVAEPEETVDAESEEQEAVEPQAGSVVETIEGLTLDEQATNFDTMRHIEMVRNLLNRIIIELIKRGQRHDQSKLAAPEVGLFTEFTPKLKHTTYGSQEYEDYRKQLAPALTHHYAKNSHHPEHYKNGIDDMSLVDLLEMFVDWKAASTRHHDGNIRKSIEKNADRFGMSPQLIRILENSIPLVEDTE
jgi:hypothetical protein